MRVGRIGLERRVAGWIAVAGLALLPASAGAENDLGDLSLEDLMRVEVTSVSKTAQSKNEAAAAVTVITNEDLRRGGFTSVPEALRVVPGLQVARIDANRWAISARGFNQEFANKLLVMIDGRSVYTPLFGGVYWDVQDLPIEDIERIEVIRGPGGTVWGENAVNGVINVVTKHSEDTQGTLVSGYGGNREAGGTARYGARLGDTTTWRTHVKGFQHWEHDVDDDYDARDEWNQGRIGVRFDGTLGEQNRWMVSSDYYHANLERGLFTGTGFRTGHQETQGGHVLLRWDHATDAHGAFTAKAYYDRTYRESTLEEDRHTTDLDLVHDFDFALTPAVPAKLTSGLNYRFSTTHVNGTPALAMVPSDEDFHLVSGFVQGRVELFEKRLAVTGGIKLGFNSWSGFEFQPSVRALANVAEGHALWAAVSRAVRVPTQLDRNLFAVLPNSSPPPATVTVVGNDEQRSEDLLSFEAGYRFYAMERITLEAAVFHNLYDDVTTLGFVSPNFTFGNRGDVQITGGEIEAIWMPVDWWRLSVGYAVLEVEADLVANPLPGIDPDETAPRHQLIMRSFFDLPAGFEFDAAFYWVDGLDKVIPFRIPPSRDNVEQLLRLDLRLGWQPTDWLEISLVGQNLVQRRHAEFTDVRLNLASEVPRSGYGKVTLRF